MATSSDPFLRSMLALSSVRRIAGVAVIVALLWIGIAWAVSLP